MKNYNVTKAQDNTNSIDKGVDCGQEILSASADVFHPNGSISYLFLRIQIVCLMH